ncbi:hypothetical protein [Fimbriimonas ginsengisoli]|uniref:Uncharacterized protein n=1 Tax=Fimbriimonas ginsengisoli Gsoil 348 TaxID=661478 RepID=A0A068NYY9_FIMGI|nr:hypothetical protein [Fimbriimonas ginsengisoli]AIE87654.1 hypothetical protein OP10G_4286 [Fimbriimonas ginsengisoli Gsoil 348]
MSRDPLDNLSVVRQCPAQWSRMIGDDQIRFCSHCNQNVYNLTNMSREEAKAVLSETEGKLCARFYKRGDGTIVTRDCSPAVKAGTKLKVAFVAVFGGALAALGFPILAPVYSGQVKMSPHQLVSKYARRLVRIDEQIGESKDTEEKKALLEWREEIERNLDKALKDERKGASR